MATQNPKRNTRVLLGAIAVILVAGFFISSLSQSASMSMLGNSMNPTIANGQKVLVLDGYYENSPVERGDVVTVKLKTLSDILVMRVIAIPGDVLDFTEGRMLLNGAEINEPYLIDSEYLFSDSDLRIIRIPLERVGTVPDNSVFCLNDNRVIGGDSRTLGFIPVDYLKGKIII